MLGGLLASSLMWGEIIHRITWTGGGERADWGEPLFYAIILAVPGSGVGAVVGALFALCLRWFQRTRSPDTEGAPPDP